ncbi:hypothetical protein I4U23_016583 [Adineta vaga]|nr:hypothetical protein I4U23_016583 [Adineta vaga]
MVHAYCTDNIRFNYESNDNLSFRSDRLFYVKMEITEMMLRNPYTMERKILQIPSTQRQYLQSGDEIDYLKPQKKRKREFNSKSSTTIQFDEIEYWSQVEQRLRLRWKNKYCTMKRKFHCLKYQAHPYLNASHNSFQSCY